MTDKEKRIIEISLVEAGLEPYSKGPMFETRSLNRRQRLKQSV